jgi:hypothetical protein
LQTDKNKTFFGCFKPNINQIQQNIKTKVTFKTSFNRTLYQKANIRQLYATFITKIKNKKSFQNFLLAKV